MPGTLDGFGDSSVNINKGEIEKKIELGSRTLRAMDDEIASYPAGESGASLESVVAHCEGKNTGYGLVNEVFLEELRADHNKIKDLMERLGETREEVSIVVRGADGNYTRMLLKKNTEGNYEEIDKNVNSEKKKKTHRQDNDLFIFEQGVKNLGV